MARQGCIFCGNSPTTKEHLVSSWVADLLAGMKPPPSAPDKTVVALHQRWSEGAEEEISQEWFTKNAPEFTVKCVCGTCNHGWMSKIESAAAPIMTQMIGGQAVTLDTKEQEKVSMWMGLKAIVAQHSLPPAQIVLEWTEAFAAERRPPRSWQIRIGYYEGERPLLFANTGLDATLVHSLSPVTTKQPGFLFTVQIGHLVGQVIGIRQQARFLRVQRRFIRIWPHPLLRADPPDVSHIASHSWPPERGLNDSDLTKCTKDPAEPKD